MCFLNCKYCFFRIIAYLREHISLSQPLSLPWQPMCDWLTDLLTHTRIFYICEGCI
jgi:hypothetical protein